MLWIIKLASPSAGKPYHLLLKYSSVRGTDTAAMLAIANCPGTTLFLGCVYLVLALLTIQRLLWLEANATRSDIKVNTKKLFVVACLVVCILRVISFTSITIINYNFTGRLDEAISGPASLSDKVNIVLFDLPDFFCVSAYVLLLVVWAEAYLKSRQHWLSTATFRHYWMLGYAVFNVNLYAVQIALYSMMFVPSIDPAYLSVWIYAVLTTINLCLPLIWAAGFLYLTFVFSGFPLSSDASKLRLSTLSRVGTVWTLTRLGWGLVTLSSVLRMWLDELCERSALLYSIALVLLFLFAEVLPIVLSLQEATIQSLAAAARAQSVSFAIGQSILGAAMQSSADSADAEGMGGGYAHVRDGNDLFDTSELSYGNGPGLQLTPLAHSIGVAFPPPDPAYATPTAPSNRKQLRVESIGSQRSNPSPNRRPSPGALASLHHQQGKHLVGRPLLSSGGGSGGSSGVVASVERQSSSLRLVDSRPSAQADEEWSGDEESVTQTSRRRTGSTNTLRTGTLTENTALLGAGQGGFWGWVQGRV